MVRNSARRGFAFMLAVLLVFQGALPSTFAGTPVSGDAVYRTMGGTKALVFFPPTFGIAMTGHTGIVDGSVVRDMQWAGISSSTLSTWKSTAVYLGARHKGQTPVQGQAIASLVRGQRCVRYEILSGYKSPGLSFRCDGLVEWAYESVGLNIVWDPGWWALYPTYQSSMMKFR